MNPNTKIKIVTLSIFKIYLYGTNSISLLSGHLHKEITSPTFFFLNKTDSKYTEIVPN